jgi:hypothetical protein
MITIFAQPITKDYFTNTCSLTFFVFAITLLFTIIFPFLAAYASDKFWIRESIITDSPIFLYNNELHMYLLKNNKTYFYSTNELLNNLYPRKISSPAIKYSMFDSNYDGLTEKLVLSISLPNINNDSENIQGIKLGVFFDYGFNVSKNI